MLSMIDFLHIPTCCYLEIFSMHSPFLTFFTFFTFGVTMTKLTSYLRRGTGLYILGIASMIISVSLDMLAPQLTKHLIDDVIVAGKVDMLKILLIGYLAVGVGRAIFQYTKEFCFDYNASKIASIIRRDLFRYMQTLSANFFDKNNSGELMSRVKDDVDRIWDSLGFIGMLILEVTLHTGIVLYCMYSLSWQLAIVPTIGMIGAGTIAVFMEKKLGKVYGDIEQENSVLNNVASENLAGVRTVKAFAREKFEIQKFLSHNERYYELNVKQSRVFVKYYPFVQTITIMLPCIVLLQGGYLVINKNFTIGDLSAFLQYSMNITWPMEMLGWLMNGLSSAIEAWKRVKKIYAEEPQVKNSTSPVHLAKVNGDIAFDHVDFTLNDKNILSNISFTIKKGHTLGIMGETGSGKTSIGNLLSRTYDVTKGKILLDGTDIRQIDLNQLRQNVAPVMQDVFLFSDTIDENVRFGKRETLTEDDMKLAVNQAEAAEFVETLSDKYDTVIGERGVGLSGGQKQRLTTARALAKKACVLIFDDSTSALDMETEQEFQKTVESMEGVTKIIIAHRISAVRHADEIIILKSGKIAERGTHEQLLAKKGLYYKTWQAQYGTYTKLLHGAERKRK